MNQNILINKKEENHSDWYTELIVKCNLISYYDISGCYILLPNSYSVWENIQHFLDGQFKLRGVQNVYFPLFISKNNLEKEKNHIEGFEPEVAWIKSKDVKEDVKEDDKESSSNQIAIRPTSECAIYPTFANLVKWMSQKDLPLKYNQWCNVVRWEFKDTTPFIRSREFLWNEGHTCYATKEQAMEEVIDIIKLYKETYQNMLGVPVILGKKTEKEKFGGADVTYTVECFISESGKAIQAATSHCLGQNFSKMFDIKYQVNTENKEEVIKHEYVWQNSWGFTTRSIGIMLMTHSDNKGVVFPPNIAPTQIIIIPIIVKKYEQETKIYVDKIINILKQSTIRFKVDASNNHPGSKFINAELGGSPLRLEIGKKEVDKNKIVCFRRDTCTKNVMDFDENLIDNLNNMLKNIQNNLFHIAKDKLINAITYPNDFSEFINNVENKKMCLIKWCDKDDCEMKIKELSKAKSLCCPDLDENKEIDMRIVDGDICLHCGDKAQNICLFGRSY